MFRIFKVGDRVRSRWGRSQAIGIVEAVEVDPGQIVAPKERYRVRWGQGRWSTTNGQPRVMVTTAAGRGRPVRAGNTLTSATARRLPQLDPRGCATGLSRMNLARPPCERPPRFSYADFPAQESQDYVKATMDGEIPQSVPRCRGFGPGGPFCSGV
jgi:hypothetical protein